jgi:hypothetical protein
MPAGNALHAAFNGPFPGQVPHHGEIEQAIVVVIQPERRHRPAQFAGQPGAVWDVFESAVAAIAIELVRSQTRHE